MSADSVTVERVADSPEELAFLAAIADRPSEDSRRLLYADWLEDRGDARAGSLRGFVHAYRSGAELPELDGASRSWADLIGLTFIRQIVGCGCANRCDELLALARPGAAVGCGGTRLRQPASHANRTRHDALGGDPDLPAVPPVRRRRTECRFTSSVSSTWRTCKAPSRAAPFPRPA